MDCLPIPFTEAYFSIGRLVLGNIYIAHIVASILMFLADYPIIPREFIFEGLFAGVPDFYLDKLGFSLSSLPVKRILELFLSYFTEESYVTKYSLMEPQQSPSSQLET